MKLTLLVMLPTVAVALCLCAPAMAQDASPATIVVVSPKDARLYFDGVLTQQEGTTRTFTTPPLAIGADYFYEIKAEVLRDGKPLVQTKRISVRAGETSRVDLSKIETELASQAAPAAELPATDAGWPRRIVSDDNVLTLYQPQVEKWDRNRLKARAAVSIETKASPQPTFGVIWITARAAVDKENRLVTLDDFHVPRANFPSSPEKAEQYLDIVRKNAFLGTRTIALDRIQANLAVTEALAKTRTVAVKNEPPQIFFSTKPAILVLIDGAPVLRQVSGSTLLRVLNTRTLILFDQQTGKYYLHLVDRWLEGRALEGPWSVVQNPPPTLDPALQSFHDNPQVDLLDNVAADVKDALENGNEPGIYLSTTPAELIETQGEPEFAPVDETKLLWAKNSTSPILVDTNDQGTYVLLSGRWFRGKSLKGPWEFVAADRLPADFAKIPVTHPRGDVLASVSGTPQAQESVIADQVPQTAAIKRNEAKFEPVYDGRPKFEPIADTPLQYAANSPTPIIEVNPTTYYALENGVWFMASSPNGPWVAATSVPDVIYTIPAGSPIYYATSAYVYGSTPDVVYVGYTPGYFGTCVCPEGVVVYGTGWVWQPWIGDYWYGRPWTYGWGVRFDWTPGGWGFGFATAFGRPWWGPIGWHAGWGGRRWREGWHAGWGGPYARAHINHINFANVNVYHRWDERALVRSYGVGVTSHKGLNNVVAGPDGEVFRRGPNSTWERHTPQGWRPYDSAHASSGQRPQVQYNVNVLNDDWAARRQGEIHANRFQSSTGNYIAPVMRSYAPQAHAVGGPGGFHGAPGGFRAPPGGYRPAPAVSHSAPVRRR
jgi:uncharacterized protein (TIGR03000 family)